MDKMQPISQALYSLLFLGCMGAGFPLYVQGQNVDELLPIQFITSVMLVVV